MFDESEVEERDSAIAVEQIVARMRIAVERLEPVQTPENETEDARPSSPDSTRMAFSQSTET